jgi:hypothetical protein
MQQAPEEAPSCPLPPPHRVVQGVGEKWIFSSSRRSCGYGYGAVRSRVKMKHVKIQFRFRLHTKLNKNYIFSFNFISNVLVSYYFAQFGKFKPGISFLKHQYFYEKKRNETSFAGNASAD